MKIIYLLLAFVALSLHAGAQVKEAQLKEAQLKCSEKAVRNAGDDGVNTYRIPALCTTTKGTLLIAYDCRYDTSRDLQGHIDIGISRSIDKGATWQPMTIALDMGEWGGLPQRFNGVSDPSLLVDTKTGRIWVSALWMHGVLDNDGKFINGLNNDSKDWKHQWSGKASQSGYSPYQTSQFIMAYSDDDGVSWSEPINITKVKPEEWWLYAPAPGQGIVMKDGTLVLPTQGRDTTGLSFSNITYSKDRGESWITTNPATDNTSECAVVELKDGSLMLNIRDNRNRTEKGDKNGRAVFVSDDLGITWSEHSSSHGALIEPVCMASIHRHKKYLLFSNPDDKHGRHNMRIKWSDDEGITWHNGPLLDSGSSFGYSCLTSIDKKTIGIVWEGSRSQMAFRAISLKEIINYSGE
ncbi:MAG: sialidase family protein [Rikenellaceae bacterium]